MAPKNAGKKNAAATAVTKAKKAAKVAKTTTAKKVRKVRTSVRFHRPTTTAQKLNPKYPRKSLNSLPRLHTSRVLKCPLSTESAMKKIEEQNTMVFLCDAKASKPLIKSTMEKMYNVKVQKVNTLMRPDGQKKAFLRLTADNDALDVANRIGMI